MNQPFKFRHLDAVVGAFVIGAVALVIGGLLAVGHARQWFTGHDQLIVRTPPAAQGIRAEEVQGLVDFYEELAEAIRPGTPVELGGRSVGKVIEAHLDEQQRLSLTLDIESAERARLTTASRAVIKVPPAPILGQTRVVLKPGRGGAELDKDAVLPIERPRDTTAMATAVLRDLEANVGPLLANLNGMVTDTRTMIAEVRAQRIPERIAGILDEHQRLAATINGNGRLERDLQRVEAVLADVQQLADGIAQGKGLIGKTLADEQLHQDLAAIAGNVRVITGEVRRVAPVLPNLIRGVQDALDAALRLTDGLNRHWLLRSYTQPTDPGLLVPGGVVGGAEGKP